MRRYKKSNGSRACCWELYLSGSRHHPNCKELSDFPIQGGGSIPRWLAEIAYGHYRKQYGDTQDLDDLARRGGFGMAELVGLLRKEKWGDESWPPGVEDSIGDGMEMGPPLN